jgi:hypothetical protein
MRMKFLADRANDVLKEWDILPQDRAYTLPEVTDWLIHYMAPVMEEMRKALEEKKNESI